MAIRFGDAVENFYKGRKYRQDQQTNRIQQATALAALQDAGYDLQGTTLRRNEMFGQVPEGFVRVGGKIIS